MSDLAAGLASARERLRQIHAQIAPREYAGALLVVLQLVVWRYPAVEPTQLVRASIARPALLLWAMSERLAEGVWALLGASALIVPVVAAWLLFDPPGRSIRDHTPRLLMLWLGAAALLEAVGGGESRWLAGGLPGRATLSLFSLLLGSKARGAWMAAGVGLLSIAWASGLAGLLARQGPKLRRGAAWLASRALPAAESAAQVAARLITGAVRKLEEIEQRRSAPIAANDLEDRAVQESLPATPDGTAIEGAPGAEVSS